MQRPDELRVVRPTIRCLLHDLADEELGPEVLARSLATAHEDMDRDPRFLFPVALSDARHPILDRANAIVTDDSAHREPIAAFPGMHVIKVKTSARRGAVWRDDSGTWWLLAAGRRKDDGPGDFYRWMERLGGTFDSLAPTGVDNNYKRYEEAYLTECAHEREAQIAVVRGLLEAAATPGEEYAVDVFGAVVGIRLDAADDVAELTLTFNFIRFDERDRFPVDLIGFVPGYGNIDSWDFLPAFDEAGFPCWYTLVDQADIEMWAIAVELDNLLADQDLPPAPRTTTQQGLTHRAPASAATMGYVEGIEIAALCGARFTPHIKPDISRICPDCDSALWLLRSRRRATDG